MQFEKKLMFDVVNLLVGFLLQAHREGGRGCFMPHRSKLWPGPGHNLEVKIKVPLAVTHLCVCDICCTHLTHPRWGAVCCQEPFGGLVI